MTKAQHRAYIDSRVWKVRKERFLRSVGRRCWACSTARGPIDVHHLSYARAGAGQELDLDLRPLCRDHHQLAHAYEASGAFGPWGSDDTLTAATVAMILDVREGRKRPAKAPAGPLRRWARRQWLVATGRRYSAAWANLDPHDPWVPGARAPR